MAGTKAGGIAAAKKNLERDPNFYAKIGAKGGAAHSKGGFTDRELARRAGAIGGRISKRRKVVKDV